MVAEGRFERVGCTKFLEKSPNGLLFEKFLLPHVFLTPMHFWDQKFQNFQHRNPVKNGSLSENATKEGERVLFQPLNWKRNRRGLRWGHFDTSTEFVGPFL